MNNESYVNAFCTTQSRFEKLNAEFEARIDDIIEIGKKEGHVVRVSNGMLYIDGHGRGLGEEDYQTMMAEISKPEYQAIDKALHDAWSQGGTTPSTPTKTDLSKATVTAPDQNYTGSALKPAVTVTLNGKMLKADTDYTVTYSDNIEIGTATITVKGKGDYTGTAKGTFEIVGAISIYDCEISLEPFYYTYTGKPIKPLPVVRYEGKTLKQGTDYVLTYEDNVEVGYGCVIITGIGRFEHDWYEWFEIEELEEPLDPSDPGDDPDEPLDPSDPGDDPELVTVYRLYNWRTSEHLWTTSANEYEKLPVITNGDWRQEDVAWLAPDGVGAPVYRLYNQKMGDHYYSMDENEIRVLTTQHGWTVDNNGEPAFWSAVEDDEGAIPLFCVYNKRLKKGQHHFTRSVAEREFLTTNAGWRYEKIAFYGYPPA